MGKFSTDVKNGWLDDVTSNTMYMALFVGDPTSGGSEISGSNYARLAVPATSWGAAAAGTLKNTTAITFAQAADVWSATAVDYFALYTLATGGVIQFQDEIPSNQQAPIVQNNTVEFAINGITLTVSDPA